MNERECLAQDPGYCHHYTRETQKKQHVVINGSLRSRINGALDIAEFLDAENEKEEGGKENRRGGETLGREVLERMTHVGSPRDS